MSPSSAIWEAANPAKTGFVRSAKRSAVDLTPALTSSFVSCVPPQRPVLPYRTLSSRCHSGCACLLSVLQHRQPPRSSGTPEEW